MSRKRDRQKLITKDATKLVNEVVDGLNKVNKSVEEDVFIVSYTAAVFALAARVLEGMVSNKVPPTIH